MKVFLPWVLVAALLAAGYFLFAQYKDQSAQIAKLTQDNLELAQLRAENEELKKVPLQNKELEQLRKEHDELIALRAETQRNREKVKELNVQLASAQSQGQKVQELQQQTAQLQNENLNLQNQQEQATQQAKVAQAQYNACINNLRMIDGAKQEWALENKKSPDDVPTPEELAPYLPKDVQIACPAGGNYTINAVRTPPTCTVASHFLPK